MQGGSLGAGPRDGYDTGFQGPVGGGGVFFGGPGTGFPGDFGGPEGLFPGNEKQTMQNLNDRLSSYLEKVRALETANADLEIKIRDWYAKQITSGTISPDHDHNKFFETINDLRSKIKSPSVDNARMVLQIDNARLAADDFRLKYENELYFRQSIEADISGLKRVLEEQNMSRAELEVQIETMTEELTYLKTNHEEELQALQGQAAGQVNVEIDAAPGVALTKRLKDMRTDYEALTERNRMEAEQWFIQKSMELKREMTKGVEEVQTTTTEVSEQRRLAQSVETEMQSQLAMKKSIEDSLIETENRYGVQLMQIQLIISTTEEQLGQ
ncbi:keratin, type I cytoskeletal 47 kDa-like, partial [Ailuropoda melanoleuca]|uniref:keratin, type I cytoskeletal 47 kDa-like n=2 Tax=Tetrapoda TaxID=32523 RepID=UPI001493F0BE